MQKGYPRVPYPVRKTYLSFQQKKCPFTFEYPNYAKIEQVEAYFDTIPPSPCWFNIVLPKFNGRIYMSYEKFESDTDLTRLLSDAYNLTYKHTQKAEFIDQAQITNSHGVHGVYYEIGGNAASPIQFFLTDSAQHYIRGALYFRNPPNADSLRPIVNFVQRDIDTLLNTFRWEPPSSKTTANK